MNSTAPGSLAAVFAVFGASIGVPLIILAIIVGVFTPIPAIVLVILAVLLAVYLTYRRYNKVDEILLDDLDVVDSDEREHAEAFNLLESLSLSSGVGIPELYLTEDDSVNALAIQQSRDAAAVITTGAISSLDRLQLEGLLAEVIARLASDDARRDTIATGMLMPFLSGPASFLRPLALKVLAAVTNDERELNGDIAAVSLTRYPPGLIDALRFADPKSPSGSDATARLWVVPAPPHIPRYDLSARLAALNEF